MGRKKLDISYCISFIYKLVHKGIEVNTKNKAGNTCLHLACVKPHCEVLWEHLIRIGEFVKTSVIPHFWYD